MSDTVDIERQRPVARPPVAEDEPDDDLNPWTELIAVVVVVAMLLISVAMVAGAPAAAIWSNVSFGLSS